MEKKAGSATERMEEYMEAIWLPAVLAGFLLDLLVGDPHWLYHPVRLVGGLISAGERGLRRLFPTTPRGERLAGGVLAILVITVTASVPAGLLWLAGKIHPWLKFSLETILCYQLFAVRSLRDESMKVYRELEKGDLPGARRAVSMIVGRDTQNLDAAGVTKAAVETVAENTSDGIVAPMVFMVLGGPVLGWLYKAVNTMDSMIGYKNDRYLNFGRFAAKLDDVLNFFPARLSGLMMVVCSPLAGLNGKNAWKIFKRDRFNHASPNSAQTEAVMAGALGVQLAGDAWYFGKLHKKKTIGDSLRPVEAEDIVRANRLLYVTSAATLALLLFLGWAGCLLWSRL